MGGGAANKNDRKFLVFAPHELVERGLGAVRRFVQNAFERSRIIPSASHIEPTLYGFFYTRSLKNIDSICKVCTAHQPLNLNAAILTDISRTW